MADRKKSETARDAGASRTFDPRPYLRTIRSGRWEAEYLDVKWRLAWLRTEHPDAQITTEHVHLDDESAVFRAMVQIPNGGCATGYGSETRSDWGDFIEKAETKSIGRALAALGYGTQFALDFDFDVDPTETRVVDTPVEQDAGRRGRRRESSDGTGARSRGATGDRAEWDEFWRWARPQGYQNKTQVEEALGHSLEGMSAPQVREELSEYMARQGQDETGGEEASPE